MKKFILLSAILFATSAQAADQYKNSSQQETLTEKYDREQAQKKAAEKRAAEKGERLITPPTTPVREYTPEEKKRREDGYLTRQEKREEDRENYKSRADMREKERLEREKQRQQLPKRY